MRQTLFLITFFGLVLTLFNLVQSCSFPPPDPRVFVVRKDCNYTYRQEDVPPEGKIEYIDDVWTWTCEFKVYILVEAHGISEPKFCACGLTWSSSLNTGWETEVTGVEFVVINTVNKQVVQVLSDFSLSANTNTTNLLGSSLGNPDAIIAGFHGLVQSVTLPTIASPNSASLCFSVIQTYEWRHRRVKPLIDLDYGRTWETDCLPVAVGPQTVYTIRNVTTYDTYASFGFGLYRDNECNDLFGSWLFQTQILFPQELSSGIFAVTLEGYEIYGKSNSGSDMFFWQNLCGFDICNETYWGDSNYNTGGPFKKRSDKSNRGGVSCPSYLPTSCPEIGLILDCWTRRTAVSLRTEGTDKYLVFGPSSEVCSGSYPTSLDTIFKYWETDHGVKLREDIVPPTVAPNDFPDDRQSNIQFGAGSADEFGLPDGDHPIELFPQVFEVILSVDPDGPGVIQDGSDTTAPPTGPPTSPSVGAGVKVEVGYGLFTVVLLFLSQFF